MYVFIILGLLGIICFLIYNNLIGKKNQVENAFGGMDVQLKKRYDLIPNLIASVKQYMQHESSILEKVTELRTKALSGNLSNDEKVDLDNQISGSLANIKVAAENYPELRASENFQDLNRSLNEVESQISASRRAYNSAVTDYNNAIEMFPGLLFAGAMKLKRKNVFEIPEDERQNISVSEAFSS